MAAESLFLPPARDSRPKRIAIILRGLPGSGKSAAARKLRELELASGGEAPRVLSLDDYFITVRAAQVSRWKASCCDSLLLTAFCAMIAAAATHLFVPM